MSLGMIIVLTLLTYSITQFKPRKALEQNKETIPNQKGKPTRKPTIRQIFQIFEGITLPNTPKNETEQTDSILNPNETHRKILIPTGKNYEKIYLC